MGWAFLLFVLGCLGPLAAHGMPAAPVPLPRVSIDPAQISISGLSSGADFTVQFQVAFSNLIMGSGVFAGQTYHCAVTRFPTDPLVNGSNPSVPVCEGCPPGETLVYDHCKNHPQVVVTPTLVEWTKQQAAAGRIDPVEGLRRARIYLYRGQKDATYFQHSVQLVSDYFGHFVAQADQIQFNRTTPSAHSWPTDDWGEPCGHGVIENCNYDGAGACLNHIYGRLDNPPAASQNPDSLLRFDQQPFDSQGDRLAGLNQTGYVYIPAVCRLGQQCRLHVALHGCGVNGYYDDAVTHLSFNRWAETNRIVVLWPRMGAQAPPIPKEMHSGCWDAYAQKGADYALQSGVHMASVRAMIRALAGV